MEDLGEEGVGEVLCGGRHWEPLPPQARAGRGGGFAGTHREPVLWTQPRAGASAFRAWVQLEGRSQESEPPSAFGPPSDLLAPPVGWTRASVVIQVVSIQGPEKGGERVWRAKEQRQLMGSGVQGR